RAGRRCWRRETLLRNPEINPRPASHHGNGNERLAILRGEPFAVIVPGPRGRGARSDVYTNLVPARWHSKRQHPTGLHRPTRPTEVIVVGRIRVHAARD